MPGMNSKTGRTASRENSRAKARPRQAEQSTSALADYDTQLMLQAQEGNREAANMLFRRNHTRVSRYIARIVGNQRAVEDLTQDVFVQAMGRSDRYRPTAKVTTWLYRIATNKALNHLKRQSVQRLAPEPPDGPLEVADGHQAAPDWQLSLDELKHQVSSAIHALPINQRISLMLFEYEGCSYEQIASVLDITVEAVRSLLMRARTTLRRQLNGLI